MSSLSGLQAKAEVTADCCPTISTQSDAWPAISSEAGFQPAAAGILPAKVISEFRNWFRSAVLVLEAPGGRPEACPTTSPAASLAVRATSTAVIRSGAVSPYY